jgi:hypothetical protein
MSQRNMNKIMLKKEEEKQKMRKTKTNSTKGEKTIKR